MAQTQKCPSAPVFTSNKLSYNTLNGSGIQLPWNSAALELSFLGTQLPLNSATVELIDSGSQAGPWVGSLS